MYIIKKIDIDQVEYIWQNSPNSCIYNSPKFLKNFPNISFYCAYKGSDPIMCWPVFMNKKAEMAIPAFFY